MRSLFLALLLIFVPLAAFAGPDGDLRKAKDYFEYGEYEKAREIAEALLTANVLAQDEQLIDANRIAGLAWFYGNKPDRLPHAERYFLQLLSIEPEYRLDPFFTPPSALQFFEEVKQAHEAQLAPIREQRRVAKEARRAEEQARRRFLADQQRQTRSDFGEKVEIREKHNLALVFLPFGAGQFQNGDKAAGITLGAVQVLAGITSVASFVAIENMRSGGFTASETELARNLDTMKWVSAALFYGAWAYSVGDAWTKFEPEVVHTLPAPATRPVARQEPAETPAPTIRITPSISAVPGGGTAGFGLVF